MISVPTISHHHHIAIALFSLILLICDKNLFSHSLAPNSWQNRLDKALLDIDGGKPQQRFRLVQRALSDDKFLSDINRGISAVRKDGMGKGHPALIDALWPKGTIARKDIEGIQSLIKTLPERLDENRNENSVKIIQQSINTIVEPQSISKIFQEALSNRKESTTLLENIFRREPKEVEKIPCNTIATFKPIEDEDTTITIQEFDPYKSVLCELDSSDYTLANMGSGLLRLTAFVLGSNIDDSDEQRIAKKMTVPFIIQKSRMWIKCPKDLENAEPKETNSDFESSSSSLKIEDRSMQTLALLEFSGICTNEEIGRQTNILMEYMMDNEEWIVTDEEVFVLQYNAPATVPWRRKNQIGVTVQTRNETESSFENIESKGNESSVEYIENKSNESSFEKIENKSNESSVEKIENKSNESSFENIENESNESNSFSNDNERPVTEEEEN